jgi:precorrin-2 methylase
MGTLSKKHVAEWSKKRNTVKYTSHGDSILYSTYNNTIR